MLRQLHPVRLFLALRSQVFVYSYSVYQLGRTAQPGLLLPLERGMVSLVQGLSALPQVRNGAGQRQLLNVSLGVNSLATREPRTKYTYGTGCERGCQAR